MGNQFTNTENHQIIKKYVKMHPQMFKRTLARLIIQENPEVFGICDNANIGRVRGSIQVLTGCAGKEKRKLQDRLFMSAFQPDYNFEIKPNVIIKPGKALIIADIHGYNSVASERLRDYFLFAKDQKCDTIILNGDIIDNEQLARWQQVSKRTRLQQEYDWVQEFMCDITDMFPNAKRYYKFGNHELWYQKALWNNPNIMGIESIEEALRLENILGVKDCGFNFVDYTQSMECGDLLVNHGHEAKRGGQYIANTMLNYYGQSIAFDHFHRIDKAKKTIFGKKNIYGYSLPCARTLSAEYTGINNQWEKGFAICEFDKDSHEMLIYTDINNKLRLY